MLKIQFSNTCKIVRIRKIPVERVLAKIRYKHRVKVKIALRGYMDVWGVFAKNRIFKKCEKAEFVYIFIINI